MSAKKFLEVAEKSGLLEASVLADLRRQLKDSKTRPETLAKYLVEKGHLTKFQATKLINEVAADEPEPEVKQAKSAESKAPKSAPEPKPAKPKNDDDDLLFLAPIDDETEPTPAPSGKKSTPAPSAKSTPAPKPAKASPPPPDEGLILDDTDTEGLTPVEDARGGLTWIGNRQALTGVDHASGGLTPLPAEPMELEPMPMGGLGDAGNADPFGGGLTPVTPQPTFKPKKKATVWDSKLMLGGFTVLFICVLVGGVLLRNFLAVPATQIYEAAEKAYRDAAYSDSKTKFEEFLKKYPRHDDASKARVRVNLARIRMDLGDPERGLATAQAVIPELIKEEEAEIAREEFPGMLPQIAEGFVDRAKQAKDNASREKSIAKAKEAMKLVNDPETISISRRRPIDPQLRRINEDIGLVERTIDQEKELLVAIAEIGKAEAAGETVKAFELHHDLLKRYPAVRDNAALRESVAKILERERSLVKVVEEPIAAVSKNEVRVSEYRVVLSSRKGTGEAKPKNPITAILAAGSAYALDAGGGQVLWSRFVGHGARSRPVRISNDPEADILLIDRQQKDLLRIQARSGEVAWRFPIGEDSSEPTISGARAYLSTTSGRLLEIDLTTGESKRHVVIPQKLSVPPAAASDQPFVFQVGEHSNVYVLNADSLKCEDVVYLGHQAGAIEVVPLLLFGHVFFSENLGSNARVHAMKVRGDGKGPRLVATQEPLAVVGRIVVPLIVYNKRLLVLTDRGEIRVYDVDKTKTENSVNNVGRLAPTLDSPLIGYPLADATTLWIADNKLTKYTLQAAKKELVRDSAITGVGDTFIAPLDIFGTSLVHTRRVGNSTGVTVAAIHVDNPRQVLWQTSVGVPAGRIAVNPTSNEIVAISSGAALYQIDSEAWKNGYSDSPTATAGSGSSLSFTDPVEFEKDVVALFNPAENQQLLVYDPNAASRLRLVSLKLGDGKATCTPVAFQGGLLTPVDSGQVLLLKLTDGTNQVLPFQPKLEPGAKIQWRRPAIVGNEGREFVIADDGKNIYRVGIKDQPTAQLAELANNHLEVDLASGLAAAGDVLYGFVRAGNGDVVVAISASELKLMKEWDLKGGRVTWGPEAVHGSVMFVTDEKELRCFTADQKELWEKPAVMHGQPSGRPLVDGDDFVFSSVSGAVWRVAGATGAETGKVELGEPLGAGPVAYKNKVLLCGNDGSLHVIAMPVATPAGS